MYSHLSIVIFLYFPAYLGRIILVFSTLFLKNIWSFSLESNIAGPVTKSVDLNNS